MSSVLITVGFCVWNEEKNIGNVLQRAFVQLTRDFPDNFEVLIIDNCSNDSTFEITSNFIHDKPNFRIIKHTYNKLYSGSNNTILSESKGKFIVTMDGDGQHSFKDVRMAISIMNESNSDVFFGWKKNRNDKVLRKITSIGFKVLTKVILKSNLKGINCGFRIFRSSIKEKFVLKEKFNSAGRENILFYILNLREFMFCRYF